MSDDNDAQAAELAASERALAPVLADVERTCEIRATIWITSEDGYPQVWVSDGTSSGCASQPLPEDPELAKAEMADYVQEQLTLRPHFGRTTSGRYALGAASSQQPSTRR
jgi:hypothetical protein